MRAAPTKKRPRTGPLLAAAALLTLWAAASGVPGLRLNAAPADTLLRLAMHKPSLPEGFPLLSWVFPAAAEEPAAPEPAATPVPTPSLRPTPSPTPAPAPVPREEPKTPPAALTPEPEPLIPQDARDLIAATFAPSSAQGYDAEGAVFVNNETAQEIDIAALSAQDLDLGLSPDQPQILILHTHGSESFFPDERDYYVPTDVERTEDSRYNVVRLGDELTETLERKGLRVIHDRAIHDYPSYSGSYASALETITGIVQEYPGIGVVIDIHRDSIVREDGTMYKAVADTADGTAAQMMLVVGTDDGGLTHPGWRDNLAHAIQLQLRLGAVAPNLMRPVNLRRERFNQHAAPGSMILEIGTAGNTLQEALRAARLFGETAGDFWLEQLR